ncbi:MAG: nitroreductase family protein [Thermoanaerobaculales bacterium]|nr:nitroreductase family protein [Thermoanaerobaculales bacterium]
MEFDEVIRKRRTVRVFRDDPVDEATLRLVLEAGNQAPSACNVQGWRFRRLDGAEKEKLVRLGGADFIAKAPFACLVLYPFSSDTYDDEVQSAAACIENMFLKAIDLGLGGCWVCHLPASRRLRCALDIPWHYRIIACVVLGYPGKEPRPVARKSTVDQLFELEQPRLTFRALAKYLYMRQPFRPAFIENIFTKRFEN